MTSNQNSNPDINTVDENDLVTIMELPIPSIIQLIKKTKNMFLIDKVLEWTDRKIIGFNALLSLKILTNDHNRLEALQNKLADYLELIDVAQTRWAEIHKNFNLQGPAIMSPAPIGFENPFSFIPSPDVVNLNDVNLQEVPEDFKKAVRFSMDNINKKAREHLSDTILKNMELIDYQLAKLFGDKYYKIKDKIPEDLKQKVIKSNLKFIEYMMKDPEFDPFEANEGMKALETLTVKINQLIAIENQKEDNELK